MESLFQKMKIKHNRLYPVELHGFKIAEKPYPSETDATVWLKQKIILFNTQQFDKIMLALKNPSKMNDLDKFIAKLIKERKDETGKK